MSSSLTRLLKPCCMKETTKFDAHSAQIFMESFASVILQNPSILTPGPTTGGGTQKQLVRQFVHMTFPLSARYMLKQADPQCLQDCYSAWKSVIDKSIDNMIFNDIVLSNNCHIYISSNSDTRSLVPSSPIVKHGFRQNKVEGVVAKVASTASSSIICQNCNGFHSFQYCPKNCMICHKGPLHKYMSKKCKSRSDQFPQRDSKVKNSHYEVCKHQLILYNGCNYSICSDISHSDYPHILSRSPILNQITTASDHQISPTGMINMAGLSAVYAPAINGSLVSISQLCKEKNACVIFDSSSAHGFILSNELISLFDKIKSIARQQDAICITGLLDPSDNLYYISSTNQSNSISYDNSNISSDIIAGSAFYSTAEFSTLQDQVRFFHEVWNHASQELMIHNIKHGRFLNIPSTLRKLFAVIFLTVKHVQLEIWLDVQIQLQQQQQQQHLVLLFLEKKLN